MRIFARLEKNRNAWFVLIVLFFFFLLRFPSLFEPYWYSDEGVYQTLGMAIKDGRLLYRDIWDNKPPLIYLLYALFNSDQFATRLVSLIFGLLSIIVFFFVAKKLFDSRCKGSRIYSFATIIFAILLGLPLIEGNIANVENFMLLPILLAVLLVYNFTLRTVIPAKAGIQESTRFPIKSGMTKMRNMSHYLVLFVAGLLLGIAFLFKVVAFFDLAAFIVFLIVPGMRQRLALKDISNQIISVSVGFIFPIILTSLFFVINGAFKDFLQATFIQNVAYVGYENTFLIPQGLLFLKAILLFSIIVYLFKTRITLSLTTIFILIWFAFSLFNVFFAGRPFPHYLLVLAPSFSLIVALIFWDKKYQKIITFFLLVSMVFIFSNFHFFGKSIAYYQNFVSFLANKKSTFQYEAFFDRKTPIDYELALFLKPKINKKDKIFIWGDNAQVYKLTGALPPGKYTAAYHIAGYNDGILNTENSISQIRPKFIVIMPDQKAIPFSLSGYSARIKIQNVLIYEKIL